MIRTLVLTALLVSTCAPAFAKAEAGPRLPKEAVPTPSVSARPSNDAQDRIIAKVNGAIITSGDVWERYRMIQRSSKLPDTIEIRQDAFPQILDGLIKEKLQHQEAKRVGITVTPEDVTNAVSELAKGNKQNPATFEEKLEAQGVNLAEMRRQLEAQLAWIAVVRRVVRPSMNVTDAEVQKLTNELNAVKGKKEYKFAEIRLPAANPQQKKDSMKLAISLIREMQKGAPFHVIAQKFSVADSAKDGGLRPSVLEGEMPADIDKVLAEMPNGALANPMEVDGQVWMVLKLGERLNKGAPEQEVLRDRIGTLKLERAAAAYLSDLQDEALIEYPG